MTLSTSEAQARIRTLVAEQLGVSQDDVRPEKTILEDLGADSLDVVELVMLLEDEFDIEVSDEAAEALNTVADVERYVLEHAPSA